MLIMSGRGCYKPLHMYAYIPTLKLLEVICCYRGLLFRVFYDHIIICFKTIELYKIVYIKNFNH